MSVIHLSRFILDNRGRARSCLLASQWCEFIHVEKYHAEVKGHSLELGTILWHGIDSLIIHEDRM